MSLTLSAGPDPTRAPESVSDELICQIAAVERNRMREQEEKRPRPVAPPLTRPRPYDAD